MGKVNLKDIAGRAEVSISTVSRLINDPEQVNPETREKIYAVMRELDYQPGFAIKKNAAPPVAGILSPVLDSEFHMDFLVALEKELHPRGAYPLLINSHGESSLSSFLSTDAAWLEHVDMLVVISLEIDERARGFLDARGLPVALVHSRCPWYFSVLNNNYLGGYDAGVYLREKGYRKPALVRWPGSPVCFQEERLTGFLKAMEEGGISADDIPLEESSLTIEGGAACTRRLLEKHEADVIFYTSDTMAMGGMEYCREQGLKIPGDLGIMGFDDIRMAAPLNLTTMKQFIPAKAKAVADYLIGRRENALPPEHPGEMTMTPVVVERGSC